MDNLPEGMEGLDLEWGYIRWLEKHKASAEEGMKMPELTDNRRREMERRCRVYSSALEAEVREAELRQRISKTMAILGDELTRGQIRPSLYQSIVRVMQGK